MSMGTGALQAGSGKQKLNARCNTEAELVGVDDVMAKILWTKLFIEQQGYEVLRNILFQDNKSSILLETNGRKCTGKRSRHINIRYFFATDQVRLRNVEIRHCPTENTFGDYMTKLLQGEKIRDDSRDVRRIWGFNKSFCLDVTRRGVRQWQNKIYC